MNGFRSSGQVHYAEMRDGRPVAVKIQRPGVRQQVASDLEAMEDVAEVPADRTELGERFDLVAMVAEPEGKMGPEDGRGGR